MITRLENTTMHQTTQSSQALTQEKKSKNRQRVKTSLPKVMHASMPIEGQWCVGIVEQGAITETIQVVSGAWNAKATVAASCLLQPRAGDSVACLRIAPDQVWIMSILSREEGGVNVLHCKGATQWKVANGSLEFDTDSITMRSNHLSVDSQSAQVALESAHVLGKQIKVTAGLIKVIGSTLSTVMERIQQYSKSYTRTTDGSDQVTASHVRMEAQQLMQLDAEHTLVSGKNLVKARSAQIHFG
jgi:Protein of unknown function (DUF3540)